MTCGRSGERMSDLVQNGVGNLFRRVVCCMVSPELDDLLFGNCIRNYTPAY